MSGRIERTYVVATVGVGRPDYSPQVAVTKLVTGILQQKFALTWADYIPRFNRAWTLFYTVPVGYKLNIGSILVTCDGSLIQEFQLVESVAGVFTLLIDDYRFDTRAEIILGPQSAVETSENIELWMTFQNNDEVSHAFALNLQGFIERVS